MQKVYKSLTADQKSRGVVFSSTLSEARTEQEGDTIHEVLLDEQEASEKIDRLLDDEFFNKSEWKYNIIRR